jgi:branched-chain amino acid aminotransferase
VIVSLTSDGQTGDVYILVEPFKPWPEDLYQTGVRCVTRFLTRQEPRAKSTDFIAPSRRVKWALPPDVHEVLIVDEEDRILEGTTSNFFAVMGGALRTAGQGVLEGITRSLVLEIAREMLPIHFEPVTRHQVLALSEAFITSSSREVVPVVVIDDTPVGQGTPGPLARELLRRYRQRVREELAPAIEEVAL